MNNLLPSRTVIAFVLVPALTIVSVIGLMSINAQGSEQTLSESEILANTLREGNLAFQEIDTDGDGLKDWEEFLYQTDERNPDTDGDGSSDGSEVARGFDPLVSGTGTTTAEVETASATGLYFYKEDKTLSKTDILSRDTFTTYLELRKSGGLEEDQIVQRSLEQAIRENATIENEIKYSLEDLSVVPATQATRRTYRNQYDRAARSALAAQYDEVELLAQYLYNRDLYAFGLLETNQGLYESFIDSLLTMSVPEDIARVHLELLNNMSIAVTSLEGMRTVDEDPLNALIFSQKFSDDRDIVLKNTQALKLYFDSNGL